MSDREVKNRIHRKTAMVFGVLLLVTAVAYFLTGVLPAPFGIQAWQWMLPLSLAIAAVRIANTELRRG